MLKNETIYLSTFAGLHGLATMSTLPPPIIYASGDNLRYTREMGLANCDTPCPCETHRWNRYMPTMFGKSFCLS